MTLKRACPRIQAWVQDLAANDRKPGTVRNMFRVLKMVMDLAVKDGRIPGNPCTGVTLPRGEARVMKFLAAKQVAELAQEVGEGNALLVRFAAYTGLRAGEIAGLRVRDLDMKAGTLRVRKSISNVGGRLEETEPKTKAGLRTVGIPEFVLRELRDHLSSRAFDPDARVFVGSRTCGTWRHANWYGRVFRPAVRRLVDEGVWPEELRSLRFHDLRHTYASLLVEQGAHPKEMAEAMGHSSVQITLDRYSHVMPHLRDALTMRLDAAYANVRPSERSASGGVVPIGRRP